jgi:hypothetical protein
MPARGRIESLGVLDVDLDLELVGAHRVVTDSAPYALPGRLHAGLGKVFR